MRIIREKKKLIVLITVIVLAILIGVGVAVNATGSSGGIAKSVTFSENMDGAYVYFRAVDGAGNVGEWSEPQRLFIDTDAPIVTCTVPNNTLSIAEGDVLELADYFTVTANGSNTDIDITYTIGEVECSTTEGLTAEGSPYTVICTASKVGGNSGSATMEIEVEVGGITAAQVAENPSLYYGKEITGYTCTNSAGINKWLIFHSDGTNIYMIADDYITYNYMPPTRSGTTIANSGYTEYCVYFPDFCGDYSSGPAHVLDANITDPRILQYIDYVQSDYGRASTYINMQCVAYMLDTTRWSAKFGNSEYADYAIGGPTVELFADSYNKLYPSFNIGYSHAFSYGYKVGTGGASGSDYIRGLDTENPLYINDTEYDRAYGYWLAAPSAYGDGCLVRVYYLGYLGNGMYTYYDYDYDSLGFRPLVCLSSDVKLVEQEGGTYSLRK